MIQFMPNLWIMIFFLNMFLFIFNYLIIYFNKMF